MKLDIEHVDTISVLGTTYHVFFKNKEDDIRLKDCWGYTDWTNKRIGICITKEDNLSSLADFNKFLKKVVRHEIIHAFLCESGLIDHMSGEEGHNEQFIDWFALQYQKILKVFEKLGVNE